MARGAGPALAAVGEAARLARERVAGVARGLHDAVARVAVHVGRGEGERLEYGVRGRGGGDGFGEVEGARVGRGQVLDAELTEVRDDGAVGAGSWAWAGAGTAAGTEGGWGAGARTCVGWRDGPCAGAGAWAVAGCERAEVAHQGWRERGV